MGGLGGREEMERLLGLDSKKLQAECLAIPWHLRKPGSFALEDGHTNPVAVVGLFQAWLFNAGARRLGAETTWQEFLKPEFQHADDKLASTFSLDDSVFSAADILKDFAEGRSHGECKLSGHLLRDGKFRIIGAWWRLVWQQACAEVHKRFGPERRCLSICRSQQLQLRLQELVRKEDYLAAAAVKEELYALTPPRLEQATGDKKSAATFEFSMEELYRILFEEEASFEREGQLNALFTECSWYVRHTQPNSLIKECGRLKMQHSATFQSRFDIQTRQVLWKYAVKAWMDGWLAAGTSAQTAAECEDKEKEAAKIIELPKESVRDEGNGYYRFRGYKVPAATKEEGWQLLNELYQEEQERVARVQRMAKRAKRTRAGNESHLTQTTRRK